MTALHVYEQGGRHRAAGKPCQDRTWAMEEEGVSAIALADGAGNERYTHAEYGAACVTETIARFLCRNFDRICGTEERQLRQIIEKVCQDKLRDRARELGLAGIEPLSSTLLAAAVRGDTLILCHVGDGVIGGVEAGRTVLLSGPENGEFASTTYFIASPGAAEHVRVTIRPVDRLETVFLMSDGASDYTFNESDSSFTDGAGAMAAMLQAEDGEEQLRRTIRRFMTEADPRSDDCSFAVMQVGIPAVAAETTSVPEGSEGRTGTGTEGTDTGTGQKDREEKGPAGWKLPFPLDLRTGTAAAVIVAISVRCLWILGGSDDTDLPGPAEITEESSEQQTVSEQPAEGTTKEQPSEGTTEEQPAEGTTEEQPSEGSTEEQSAEEEAETGTGGIVKPAQIPDSAVQQILKEEQLISDRIAMAEKYRESVREILDEVSYSVNILIY